MSAHCRRNVLLLDPDDARRPAYDRVVRVASWAFILTVTMTAAVRPPVAVA